MWEISENYRNTLITEFTFIKVIRLWLGKMSSLLIIKRVSVFDFSTFVNLIHASALFLHPLKTENLWFPDIFRVYGKRPVVRSIHRRCSVRKGVLRNFTNFTGKHLCQSLFFNEVATLRSAILLKKETLAQVFSCEFCEIPKNTLFYRTPLVVASEWYEIV